MHQSIPPAPSRSPPPPPPPLRATAGHLQIFFTARRPGIFQPRGHSQAFKHARGFLSEYNNTEGFTG